MKNKFNVESDISKAETLPSSFYKDSKVFEDLKSKIFLKSWQWIGDTDMVKDKSSVYPSTIWSHWMISHSRTLAARWKVWKLVLVCQCESSLSQH